VGGSEDWAHFIYYGAFLLFISAGLVSRYRGKGGKALQHFSMWAAFFFIIILAYGFRHPLKDAANVWKAE